MKNRRKGIFLQLLFGAVLCPALLGAGPAGTPSLSGPASPAAGPPQEAETLTWESPVFSGTGEEFKPKEELEQGGKRYRLASTRIRSAKKEGELTYASASKNYMLEGKAAPPEKAVITITDEASGTIFEREVPRLRAVEKEAIWLDDFTFQVTVAGYDAESFYLGELEIPADQSLSDYGEEFLAYLELPADCYQVDEISWEGESYEKDGVLCRDARAKGARLVRNVEAVYGGQVRTPEIAGRQYIGIYEEILPETAVETEGLEEPETEKTMAADTVSKPGREVAPPVVPSRAPAEQIFRFLVEHLTVVTLGAGFFLALLAVLFLIFYRKKKKAG